MINHKNHFKITSDTFFENLSSGKILQKDIRFDVIFIDEAQDLSPIQWKMYDILKTHSKHIIQAGDDDQAIFEWNGANVIDYINFPGRDYVLTQSHRLPKIVHNFSTHISDMIKPRVVKKFLPSDKHGEILTHPRFTDLVDAVNTLPGSWIILGRTQEIVRELEDHARQSGLFFKNTKGKLLIIF